MSLWHTPARLCQQLAGPFLLMMVSHPEIVKRLRRHHLRSFVTMIASGRSCVDIAQQLYAGRPARRVWDLP